MKTITIKKPKIRIPVAKPSIRHKSKKDYKRKKSFGEELIESLNEALRKEKQNESK